MVLVDKHTTAAKDNVMSGAKILVVEDDSYLRASIKDILEIEHYDVVTAHDGRQGLEILQQAADSPPDLIVSDIMMPYMDGFELLEEVRKESRWVGIPFIFLTAKSEKVDMYKGKDLGADDYLHKPFDAEDLLVAVKSRLTRYGDLKRREREMAEGAVSDHKKGLLAMLGHEFRTPLTLVVAYNEMLKDFDRGMVNDSDMMSFLKGINDGAARLRRLVENFMLLVELENGEAMKNYSWRKRKIDNIESVLKTAYQQIFSEQGLNPCQIQVEGSVPMITGDFDLLVIAVRELLHNAVKFSKPDQPISVGASADDKEVCVYVEDQGVGMPEDEYEKIWEMFYQIDREHRETQGSGSGLAIVKGIADIHQGRTGVSSTVGKGSRLSIYLPSDPI